MSNARTAFISAAIWHGPLDEAEQLLAANPDLEAADIHTAAITGNAKAVRQLLAGDPGKAEAPAGPYGGSPLVYLCMSKYLRLDKSHSREFLDAATALLDAGADPKSGFWTTGQNPEFETALYGAAGIAHNAELTKLLLKFGADPNDNEAAYHSPEGYDSGAMEALVETGQMTKENLTMMLLRKLDWHDESGVEYLLAHGADPNIRWKGKRYPLHHAIERCNGLPLIRPLLDYGANPLQKSRGLTAVARAAREGRKDVLGLFEERGTPIELEEADRLIAACAMGYADAAKKIAADSPQLRQELLKMGGDLLARFTLGNNEHGVRRLLEVGVDVNAPYLTGDGYFDIARASLAIHVAAWLGHPNLVKLLIEKGSRVDTPDLKGRTPLALAVKACVDSFWMRRRGPGSVKALLEAGASTKGINIPCGYAEVDELLETASS